MKFKTVAGDADRCSGILFNVKPNGDWLAVRYNDTEHNVVLWEFHNGIRRIVKFSGREGHSCSIAHAWHELKTDRRRRRLQGVGRRQARARIHARQRARPGPQRRSAEPDLFPANNPVLRPPVAGKVGLWSKTDSTSYFKDYVVSPAN